MKTSYGDTAVAPADPRSSTRLTFCTPPLPLKWSHCGSSADFFSRFYEGVFLGMEGNWSKGKAQARELLYGISYMANELIENAFKFRAEGNIEIEADLNDEVFVLRIANYISPEASRRFQEILAELTHGNPEELLLERIEANAAGGDGSGLGILTLISDYSAKICWTFDTPDAPDAPAPVFLETIARLPLPADPA